jgi:hypothetical protein
MESQIPTYLVGKVDVSSSRESYVKELQSQESDLVAFEEPDLERVRQEYNQSIQGLSRAEIRKLELSKRCPLSNMTNSVRDEEYQKLYNEQRPRPERRAPIPPRIENTVNAYSAAYDEALQRFDSTVHRPTSDAPAPLFKREQTKKVTMEEELMIQEMYGHKVKQNPVNVPFYNAPDISIGQTKINWDDKPSKFKSLKPTIRATMDSNKDLQEMRRWKPEADYEPLPTKLRDVEEKQNRYVLEGGEFQDLGGHQSNPLIAGIPNNENPILEQQNVDFYGYETVGDNQTRINNNHVQYDREYENNEQRYVNYDTQPYEQTNRGLKERDQRIVKGPDSTVPVEIDLNFASSIRGIVEKEHRRVSEPQTKHSDRDLPTHHDATLRGLKIGQDRKTITHEDNQYNLEFGTELKSNPRLILNKASEVTVNENVNEYPEHFATQIQHSSGALRGGKFEEKKYAVNEAGLEQTYGLIPETKARSVKEGNRHQNTLEDQTESIIEYGTTTQPTVRGGVHRENTIHNREYTNDTMEMNYEPVNGGKIRVVPGGMRHENEAVEEGFEYRGPVMQRTTQHYFKPRNPRTKPITENPTVSGLDEPKPERRNEVRPRLGRMTMEENVVVKEGVNQGLDDGTIKRRDPRTVQTVRKMGVNVPEDSNYKTREPEVRTSVRRISTKISSVNSTPLTTPDWRRPLHDNRMEADYIAKHMDLPSPY